MYHIGKESAVNESTITLSGKALGKVKAADITVAGAEVASVTPSADWKTATVALKGTLPANKDVKASVKVGTETKDFTVKYGFDPKAVSVKEETFDNDTKNQKLTVLVDGEAKSVDWLRSAGYTVEFRQFDKNEAATTDLLASSNNLKDSIQVGDYYVIAQISKDGKILTSDKVKIKVTNFDNAATAINAYDLYNTTNALATFKQTSSTLVLGDTAELRNLEIGAGSNKTVLGTTLNNKNVKVESSDNTVVTVNSSNQLVANKLGTATIKVTVGKATKEFTVTVAGELRKATAVDAKNVSILNNKNTAQNIKVLVKDQYGDPVVNTTTTFKADFNTGIAGVTGQTYDAATTPAPTTGAAIDYLVTNANGEAIIALTAVPGTTPAGKSGSIVIKKGTSSTVVTSFTVSTTDNDAVKSKKFAIASGSLSKDNILDVELDTDNSVKYQVASLNSDGVVLNNATDLQDYNIKFNSDLVKVFALDNTGAKIGAALTSNSTLPAGTFGLEVDGVDEGTTTIALSKGTETISQDVTVKASSTEIKSVAWIGGDTNTAFAKSGTINYETVLDTVPGANDPAIKEGTIALTSPVLYTLRLDKSTGYIYVDADNDGQYQAGGTTKDYRIGKLEIAVNSESNLTGTTNPVTGVQVSATDGKAYKGTVTFRVSNETTATPSNKTKYYSTKTVTVDLKGTTPAQELAAAKTTAKSSLASYKAAADYTVNATALTTAITNGNTAIDAATSTADVTTALTSAKTAIDAINSDQTLATNAATALTASSITFDTTANATSTSPKVKDIATAANVSYAYSTSAVTGTGLSVAAPDANGDIVITRGTAAGSFTLTVTATVGSKTATKAFTVSVPNDTTAVTVAP